jgi:hypothetical protein
MRRPARKLAIVVMLALACGVTTAFAAKLPTSSTKVGAGNKAIAACDSDGVTVAYTNAYDTTAADYRTSAVTVSNINTACNGETLTVTIRNSSGTSLWQGSTTVSSTSATISTSSIVASSIAGWAVAVSG